MTAVESKKFNVGDKVISVKDISNSSFRELWSILKQVLPPYDYTVEIDGSHEFFNENELELLSVSKPKSATVKSDGGSSSYYELIISNKAGETIKVETGDVIRALVGNDFDFGNCVKALRRMYLATLGMGKEGTNIPYDANKIRWFLGEIERVNNK